MAEHGYFVKEMNAGWLEWTEDELPTHSQRQIDEGTIRCDCSSGDSSISRGQSQADPESLRP